MNRRTLLTTFGGAVVGFGCGNPSPTRRREVTAREPTPTPPAIFENFHRSLLQVHGELRTGVDGILAAVARNASGTGGLIASFCEELLNHHHAEDAFFFPSFRAAGRLRSSDVAFLDARDAEHRDVHRLCLELRDVARRHVQGEVADDAWRATVTRTAGELSAISIPHFAAEESALTAPHVATLITAEELTAVYRDMGENWHRR